jgi:energy-coupling factor transport system ATP-binding protein
MLDEPTAWLDPVGTTEVFNVISRLCKEYHKTVVMTEQKVKYLAEFADRVVVMGSRRNQIYRKT